MREMHSGGGERMGRDSFIERSGKATLSSSVCLGGASHEKIPWQVEQQGKTLRWNAITVFEEYLRNKTIGSKGDTFLVWGEVAQALAKEFVVGQLIGWSVGWSERELVSVLETS